MRVVMVGLGSIGRKHVRALRQCAPGAQVWALRSSTESVPMEGVQDIYSLEGRSFDFAIVSNPTSCHASTVRELLNLRIPLFIEKPLFGELGHEDLLKEIRRAQILTYVACNLRFMDMLQFLKEHIKGLRINEVNVYCGSYLPQWRPGTDWRNCYSARPELGGGVHLDLIHELDYVYWFFGKPERSSRVLRSRSSLSIPAADYANYCLEYPDFCVSVVLNYFRRDYRRTVEIVAENGTFTANLEKGTVSDASGNLLFTSSQEDFEIYCAQMGYFLSLLQKNASRSSNDVFEAYEVLKLCLE